MTHALRTTAGSHERFLVIEVFGRYAGFTALLPTMAGAANRCVIPEVQVQHRDALRAPDRGPLDQPQPLFGRPRLRGGHVRRAATWSSRATRRTCSATRSSAASATGSPTTSSELSPKFNNGRRINVISQRLSYLVRCGDPDAIDSIVPMAFGNLALDLHPGGPDRPDGLPAQRRSTTTSPSRS